MEQSENINELAKSLAAAQGEIKNPKKDSENPFFKSHYADLSSVWDACRGPLSKNGLSVIQTTKQGEGSKVTLVTTLLHISGQWVRGEFPVIPVKADPQGWGSALTYARRYTISALVGIAPEDDDAEEACGRSKSPQYAKPSSVPHQTKPAQEKIDPGASVPEKQAYPEEPPEEFHPPEKEAVPVKKGTATEKQMNFIRSICRGASLDPNEECQGQLGKRLSELSGIEASEMIKHLQGVAV